MSTVKCRDPRSGVVYVYSSHNYWDKEAKKQRATRKLIGKLDENGNLIPTRGHPGRPPKEQAPVAETSAGNSGTDTQALTEQYEARLAAQFEKIRELESSIQQMKRDTERKNKKMAEALSSLMALVQDS